MIDGETDKIIYSRIAVEERNRRSLARLNGTNTANADLDINMSRDDPGNQGPKSDGPANLVPKRDTLTPKPPPPEGESTAAPRDDEGVAVSKAAGEKSSYGYKVGDIIPYAILRKSDFVYPSRGIPWNDADEDKNEEQ